MATVRPKPTADPTSAPEANGRHPARRNFAEDGVATDDPDRLNTLGLHHASRPRIRGYALRSRASAPQETRDARFAFAYIHRERARPGAVTRDLRRSGAIAALSRA